MNTIKNIKETFQQLNSIYGLTKNKYTLKEKLHVPNKVINLLLRKTIIIKLIEKENKSNVFYKWVGAKPTFEFSYDFHYKLRGKDNTYQDVIKMMKNTRNLKPNEILDALTIISQNEKLSQIKTNEETSFLIETPTPAIIAVPPTKTNENFIIQQDIKTLTFLQEMFNDPDKSILLGLLTDLINLLGENNDIVTTIKNTNSAIIGITKSNQENMFDLIASQYNLIREQYVILKELTEKSDDELLKRRFIIMRSALEIMKKRIDSNEIIRKKYGRKIINL